MPSIVAISESGERLVGQLAKRQAVTNPEHTALAVKRLIGRKIGDEHVDLAQRVSAIELVGAQNGDAWVRLRDRNFSPQEISAHILQKMKQTAEDFLGEEVATPSSPSCALRRRASTTRTRARSPGSTSSGSSTTPWPRSFGTDTERDGIFMIYTSAAAPSISPSSRSPTGSSRCAPRAAPSSAERTSTASSSTSGRDHRSRRH